MMCLKRATRRIAKASKDRTRGKDCLDAHTVWSCQRVVAWWAVRGHDSERASRSFRLDKHQSMTVGLLPQVDDSEVSTLDTYARCCRMSEAAGRCDSARYGTGALNIYARALWRDTPSFWLCNGPGILYHFFSVPRRASSSSSTPLFCMGLIHKSSNTALTVVARRVCNFRGSVVDTDLSGLCVSREDTS